MTRIDLLWATLASTAFIHSLALPAFAVPPTPLPSEPRSSETRPSETRPSETRPSETRPSETRPSETRPSEEAVQQCQNWVEADLPGTQIQIRPDSAGLEGTSIIHWQANGIAGFCRVTPTGEVVEVVNPYALPRGQRPIESIVAFQTDDYAVRIMRISEQLVLNVHNKKTNRAELNRVPVLVTESEANTTYSNLLGLVTYQAIVSADGTYRLVIQSVDRLVYDQAGVPLDVSSPSIQEASREPAVEEAER